MIPDGRTKNGKEEEGNKEEEDHKEEDDQEGRIKEEEDYKEEKEEISLRLSEGLDDNKPQTIL